MGIKTFKSLDVFLLTATHNNIIETYNLLCVSYQKIPPIPIKNFQELNEENIEKFTKEINKYNDKIKEYNNYYTKLHSEVFNYLKLLGYSNKHIQRTKHSLYPSILELCCDFKNLGQIYYNKSNDQHKLEKIESENRLKKLEIEKKELKLKACQWLMERGKEFIKDFTEDTAIELANELSIEEEIQKIKSQTKFVSFCGDDYCTDDCAGWDMESHRCQCGSRRVYWETSENQFDNPYVYAVAD